MEEPGEGGEELLKCKGSQLDPVFTDIMVQMIDEDVEYRMREQDAIQMDD